MKYFKSYFYFGDYGSYIYSDISYFEMFWIIFVEQIKIGEKFTCNESRIYTIFTLLNKLHIMYYQSYQVNNQDIIIF